MKFKLLRIFVIGCLVLASLSFAGVAYADDGAGTLPDPGITPDSPLYFFDNLGKRVAMFFTFGDEAKAARALRYAEERLAEADAMAAKNRVREMEKAAAGYDGYMAQVRERLENHGASDNVCERVALATGRHLEALAKVMDEAPPEAATAVERARTASMNGQVQALRSLAKNHPDRAVDIMSDAINGQIERVAAALSDNGTGAAVTANVTGELDYAARLAALEDEMTALAEENGIDISAKLQKLRQSTANRLRALSGVYDQAPENARTGLENAVENSVKKYTRVMERLQEEIGSDDSPPVDVMSAPPGASANSTGKVKNAASPPGNSRPAAVSANRTDKIGRGQP